MQFSLPVAFEKRSAIQCQVVQHLRRMILDGILPPGSKVPSTRSLSAQLMVSRGSVVLAYQRLAAEGYLESHSTIATYVSHHLPDTLIQSDHRDPLRAVSETGRDKAPPAATQIRPLGLYDPEQDKLLYDFRMGRGETSFFPIKTWRRLVSECLGGAAFPLSEYGDPAGYEPLRAAVCTHVLRARGVKCSPEQVIVVAGCQEGLNVIASVLVSPETAVAIEDPCYQGAAGTFESHRAQLCPIPVDDDGLDVDQLAASAAKLVYVTPSHQFPLGSTMPFGRRKRLIDWANDTGAYVIEDDYDSDFRYEHSPLSSVKAFDFAERVIYVGTFSKSIGAGLRLGYVIVPPRLAQAAVLAKSLLNNGHPWLDQAVMAEFIRTGALERHLRLIRKRYLARRDRLIDRLRQHFGAGCIIKGAEGGMHVSVRISGLALTAHELQTRLKTLGVGVYSLKESPARQFRHFDHDDEILLLGYAALSEREITVAVSRMAELCASPTLGVRLLR